MNRSGPLTQSFPTLNLLHFKRNALNIYVLLSGFGVITKPTLPQLPQFTFPVCQSRDIRNSVQLFDLLRNCSVIEGFLSITLFDSRVNETSFEGLEFPLLTEVTDFVVFYRVQGLTSLGKLFPNLRVIRGNSLLGGYSFIVYELLHLQVN